VSLAAPSERRRRTTNPELHDLLAGVAGCIGNGKGLVVAEMKEISAISALAKVLLDCDRNCELQKCDPVQPKPKTYVALMKLLLQLTLRRPF